MDAEIREAIPFNRPTVLGTELTYVQEAIRQGTLCGDGHFSRACEGWLEKHSGAAKAFLTPSGTHALEMAAMLCGIQPEDEVIMPAYTFVSTANAFVQRGARIRFVDIRPDTQNMDETLVEAAITPRTKVIVPVHYAGVGCEMNRILDIAKAYRLKVVEDAAQAVGASYAGKALGSIGDYGCYSFHATKNLTMGEGGALLLREQEQMMKAAIIREKGTNRQAFLQGNVDKYTWVSEGSSYLTSELAAACLYAQMQEADAITNRRLHNWNRYFTQLQPLAKREKIALPVVPEGCRHNGHIFYIKTASLAERMALTEHLKCDGIGAAFHYVPLHTSPQGRKCGCFIGEDRHTADTFERLLRLPMYDALTEAQVDRVCESVFAFYRQT